jgi:hypothetical protein
MTGPQHYEEAERLARVAATFHGEPTAREIQLAQLGQLHATLALAAATALDGAVLCGVVPLAEYSAWAVVAGGKPGEDQAGD